MAVTMLLLPAQTKRQFRPNISGRLSSRELTAACAVHIITRCLKTMVRLGANRRSVPGCRPGDGCI